MNTKNKKYLAIASLAVAAAALAGCSSGGGKSSSTATTSAVDGTGKTLHVLWSGNVPNPGVQKQWLAKVSADFKKLTGATVQFDTYATTADEQKKIQTSTISGTGPDIYELGISLTPVADATGSFITLDKSAWDKAGGRDRFVPATLGESGKTKDTEIAVPFVSRPYVLAYNTKMFKDAGISEPPTSWDQFIEDGKKLTRDGVYGAAIAYNDPYDPWKYVWTMAALKGNTIVDGKKARFDDPTVKSAYQTYFGFLTDDKMVDPAAVSWTDAQAITAFADGKAAMMPMATTASYPTLKDSAIKGDWAYAPMPTIPAGATSRPKDGIDAASTISGNNLAVAKYSPNQDLALAFIKFITSTKEQLTYFNTFGDLPANAEAARQVVAAHPEYDSVQQVQKRSVPTPYTGAWSDIQIALGNVVVQCLPDLTAGKIDEAKLDSLLQSAQQTAQQALDRAGDH